MNIQTPIAKNIDPDTSHLAADEITESGQRKRQLDIAVDLVGANPGMTRAELAKESGLCKFMIARRLSDAKGLLVRQGAKRKCSVDNRMVVTWWPK